MIFLYGAIVSLLWLGLAIILPVVSLLRATQAQRAIEELTARIQRLEDGLKSATSAGVRTTDAVPVASAPSGTQRTGEAVLADPEPAPHTPAFMGRPDAAPSAGDADDIAPRQAAPVIQAAAHQTVNVAAPRESLETRIGSRWMLYVGVATLILGVGFFVKYAFDNEWINETTRVLIGAACGALLVAGGLRFVRAGYVGYGRMLAGGGFAALYLSVYAAFSLYNLIGEGTAFGLFFAVSAAAGAIADRQRALGLALMAVGGGFLTPFLIGGSVDRQVVLFSYDAVLVLLTMGLASRHAWPELNLLSFLSTAATVAAWAVSYYRPSTYLATEIFLSLFCAMFLVVLRANRRAAGWRAWFVSLVLATGPVLYHLASLLVLARHSIALLTYLIAITLAGIAYASAARLPFLRLVVWIAAALPFFGWLMTHTSVSWVYASSATLLAIYGLHLIAQLDWLQRPGAGLRADEVLLFHLNGLGLFAGFYQIVDAFNSDRTGILAVALTIWNLLLMAWLRAREPNASLQALALAFAFAATAIGLQLEGAWITMGWAAEGAVVAWIGIRGRREWMRAGGLLLVAAAIVRLLSGDYFLTPAAFTVILNARVGATLFIIALLAWMARVHRGGTAARFIILGNLLAIILISAEINSYWRFRYDWSAAYLARGLTLSMAWALYAIALIVVGLVRQYAPIRYLAIALFAVTIAKVFLVDLSELSGIYRIAGFVILGFILLAASFLYERARASSESHRTETEPPKEADSPVQSPGADEEERRDGPS